MIIYSVLVGPYDTLKPLPKGITGVLFTDQTFKNTKGWEIRPLYQKFDTPHRTARWHKINSHWLFRSPTLYIDMSIQMSSVPKIDRDFINIHQHPLRNCIYKEAVECIRAGKDVESRIKKQMSRYRTVDYPKRHGLVQSGVVFRPYNDSIIRFNSFWWAEIMAGSHRDQLSFNFVSWRLSIPYVLFPSVTLEASSHFKIHHHGQPIPKQR